MADGHAHVEHAHHGHGHGHGHGKGHAPRVTTPRGALSVALALTAGFMIVEVAVGF